MLGTLRDPVLPSRPTRRTLHTLPHRVLNSICSRLTFAKFSKDHPNTGPRLKNQPGPQLLTFDGSDDETGPLNTARRESSRLFDRLSNMKRQKGQDGGKVDLPLLLKPESPDRSHKFAETAYTRAQISFDSKDNSRVKMSFCDQNLSPQHATSASNHDSRLTRAKTAPYFTHAKLGIRMYCGPGHERFPVAFRKDNGDHEKICNDWDIKIARKRMAQTSAEEFGRFVVGAFDLDSEDEDIDDDELYATPVEVLDEDVLLLQILDVFPDIEHEFARNKIRSTHRTYETAQTDYNIHPNMADIINEILEAGKYPKQRNEPVDEPHLFKYETGETIRWNRNVQNEAAYHRIGVIILAHEFDHVPTHFISKTMKEKSSIFQTYLFVEDADANYFSRSTKPYLRPKLPRLKIEKKYQPDTIDQNQRNSVQYADMVDELMAAKQHAERERLRKKHESKQAEEEATNLEIHKLQNLIIECQCCFDGETPLNRAVHCQSDPFHWMCFSCVRGLADNQIGCMKYEMLCVDASGCREKLSWEGIAQAVSVKTLDRLSFNQQQAEIVAANIEGLEQCPHCDFKAIVEPIEIDSIFSCQNPDCFKVTCRKCNEPSHLPKTCDEVKKDRGISARHVVEEARSTAMMRQCPRCKTKSIKEMGCNKMRCSCGCTFCYVCKTDLSSFRDGYEHFNARGSKCPLYDGQSEIERHDQDAIEAEREAIQRVRADFLDVTEDDLRIETGGPKIERAAPAEQNYRIANQPEPTDNVDRVGHVQDWMRRMDGLARDRRGRRGRRARPITPPAPAPEPLPDYFPFFPAHPPVAGYLPHHRIPFQWPANNEAGINVIDEALRINRFRNDIAQRRNSARLRGNGGDNGEPNRPRPDRRQTEPRMGRYENNPPNYETARRNNIPGNTGTAAQKLTSSNLDELNRVREQVRQIRPNLGIDLARQMQQLDDMQRVGQVRNAQNYRFDEHYNEIPAHQTLLQPQNHWRNPALAPALDYPFANPQEAALPCRLGRANAPRQVRTGNTPTAHNEVKGTQGRPFSFTGPTRHATFHDGNLPNTVSRRLAMLNDLDHEANGFPRNRSLRSSNARECDQ